MIDARSTGAEIASLPPSLPFRAVTGTAATSTIPAPSVSIWVASPSSTSSGDAASGMRIIDVVMPPRSWNSSSTSSFFGVNTKSLSRSMSLTVAASVSIAARSIGEVAMPSARRRVELAAESSVEAIESASLCSASLAASFEDVIFVGTMNIDPTPASPTTSAAISHGVGERRTTCWTAGAIVWAAAGSEGDDSAGSGIGAGSGVG